MHIDHSGDAGAPPAVDVLRTIWEAHGDERDALDALEPGRCCKNSRHMGFDGIADDGRDLREAWRERLAREGKLDTSGGTIRDLVLGTSADL